MTIDEIIEKLKEIDKDCKTARYSLDTVSDLLTLSKELKRHAREVNQCCY